MKIIDCFTFYNEIDLLTYRLNILYPIVDYFIIVESTHTHIGKEKPLFFNENRNLFEKFMNKIIHIIVDDLPHKYPNVNICNNDVWNNEFFQRNQTCWRRLPGRCHRDCVNSASGTSVRKPEQNPVAQFRC